MPRKIGPQPEDNELGRRLMAALISYQMGVAMDDALRRHVPARVHNTWAIVARDLLDAMVEEASQPQPKRGAAAPTVNP